VAAYRAALVDHLTPLEARPEDSRRRLVRNPLRILTPGRGRLAPLADAPVFTNPQHASKASSRR
jgi:hypothetical protein